MILLIGSQGNVGQYALRYLKQRKANIREVTHDLTKVKDDLLHFNFLRPDTFDEALNGVTKLFFIRPPQLGDPKLFYPFIDKCKEYDVKHVVFVSLMGIENNPIPPHAKIEKYIKKTGLNYTFVRPSFFMENLLYPHGADIKENNTLYVPAGNARTSFIACKDIGQVVGEVLYNSNDHLNKAYTITGPTGLTYYEVAEKFSRILGRKITYSKPKMRQYTKYMISQGYEKEYVKVTKLLYLMTRLGTAAKVTNTVDRLLNRNATTMDEFIIENKDYWC